MSSVMKDFQDSSHLYGSNAPFVEDLYEQYLQDPASVSDAWRAQFDAWQGAGKDVPHSPVIAAFERLAKEGGSAPGVATSAGDGKDLKVLQYIRAHRVLGSRQSQLDPLKRMERDLVPELEFAYYGFTDADLQREFSPGSWQGQKGPMKFGDLVAAVKKTYCGTIGLEYMYISSNEQKRWIQKRFEGTLSTPSFTAEEKRGILERISSAETLERYLHTRYVGQKRFSGEGGESLIPALDTVIEDGGGMGVKEVVLGMAHRGRLNVLVNNLGKVPADLFSEFEGKHVHTKDSSGDVKYHQGFSSDIQTPGGTVHLTLAFNPSHLEIVNPVVEGSVRARQHRHGDHTGDKVLPVLIHGDAAFAGQGVVMETMALSQTRGYRTGGTVHLIVNNQIGFTTSDTRDARSSLYCTDIAKMIEAPVFHVNGDDPEAVVFVTKAALDFRMQFHKDVVIDIVCFRRLGHNEQDEPFVTQPLMYKRIAQHPGTRKLYADRLEAEGVIAAGHADELVTSTRAALDAGKPTNAKIRYGLKPALAVDWAPYLGIDWRHEAITAVPKPKLHQLAERLTTVPENFKVHPTVERILATRREMGEGKVALDWGMAENLAYASLVDTGNPVRLSGQDCGRGTFAHRHAVIHDQNREKWDSGVYVPLQNIRQGQANFVVIDSLLSEEAVLGFEYGYSTAQPFELVIWEGQFGDFANGAQVVIDQFIAAGESKWQRLCGLTMYLPHGYEGQGPEHSSARLERFLQLCAEHNIQVVVPSTAAQFFHMIRRQVIRPMRKPLIVMTPKSLLRKKEAASPLEDLATGTFQNVIPEVEKLNAKKVRRVVACSGKVYYDIVAERARRAIDDIAVVRIEQLYPFPHEEFAAEIARYPAAKSIVWCQEEPGNMGAWHRIQHYLQRHLRADQALSYAGRASSASPAVGYLALHNEQQKALVEQALTWDAKASQEAA
ncbi:2-oxoglutarate dehydrogenase E1 component [Usitatibacter rugosus]|uniref:2-oxoglutarate dehydrogenase E1 component n=1 Tax=Usitatibacter rugosus TaxID=2732067 RepID=A0A6M4GZ28_9PROT|nr:2-oxoglutarate dehydrogenase E1 component [Usitatibacter rugosus]QJR10777.1 2-oxoglutarate dehydrogenase E1 component [Usitatibacter rugosus]